MGRRGIPTITWQDFVQLAGLDGESLMRLAFTGSWIDSDVRRDVLNKDDGTRTTFRWVKALDVAQWHRFDGERLAECGRRLEISRQRASQLYITLIDEQPFDGVDVLAARKAQESQREVQAFADAVDILRDEPGLNIFDLADRVSADVSELRTMLGDLAAFAVDPTWARQRGRSRWSDKKILSILVFYYSQCGGGILTKNAYIELSASDDTSPSADLILKRFGTWSKALIMAGLPHNEQRHDYAWARDAREALDHMTRFVLETGHTSSRAYTKWAVDKPDIIKAPEATVGRDRSWTDAIEQVYDRLRRGSDRVKFQQMFDGMARVRAADLSARRGVEFTVRARVSRPSASEPVPGEDGWDA